MLRSDRRRSNLIPAPALLSGGDLFVGSLESERLGAGPRTLYWSLTKIHLPSEDSPNARLS